MKTFYRVANINTEQGLWYDFKGSFTGLIHDRFKFCTNTDLPMPFDENIVGWLSATETIEELLTWFPLKDIRRLQKHGYYIYQYYATEFRQYKNHWLINQATSIRDQHISFHTLSLTRK